MTYSAVTRTPYQVSVSLPAQIIPHAWVNITGSVQVFDHPPFARSCVWLTFYYRNNHVDGHTW